MPNAAIVGTGVIGCLVGIELERRGFRVNLYEARSRDNKHLCSYAAGGLLSPVSELESSEATIQEMGAEAILDWKRVLHTIGSDVSVGGDGSLYVCHRGEEGLLTRVINRILNSVTDADLHLLEKNQVDSRCPHLSSEISQVYHVPGEGHVDAIQIMNDLRAHFESEARPSTVLYGKEIEPDELVGTVDVVVDCRGLGAAKRSADGRHWGQDLRGVRGEALLVHAPEVELRCPMRVVHSRTPLYIIPRSNHCYYLGATSLESDDTSPVRVRSVLELLSQAYAVHPGFKEASVLDLIVGVRPATPDNLPKFSIESGIIRFNGFYRHGYLLGPAIVRKVIERYFDDVAHHDLKSFEWKA